MTESTTNHRNEIVRIIQKQLRGDYSDALTRFSYLRDGANEFLRLINNPNYTSHDREQNLIRRMSPLLTRFLYDNSSQPQLIELGPGDGSDANLILSGLSNLNYSFSHFALDISENMLEIARENQHLSNSNYILCNFRDWNNLARVLREINNDQNRLFLLLGNTLANEVDMQLFLSSLRQSLNISENRTNYLLIGIELLQENTDQIVREYRNEENYALTIRPLQMLGINVSDGIINIDFNSERQRIEEWFIFNRRREITINSEVLRFSEGDRILLSVTYNLELNQIRRIINASGWREVTTMIENNQALILLSSISNN